jgi:hypothetical protein
MGNKRYDYYCAYVDPDEIASKTPAKRLYSVAGPYGATSVSRAVSQFWKEMMDEFEWGKRDIVLIGCQPAGLDPSMRKEDDEDEEFEEELEEEVGDVPDEGDDEDEEDDDELDFEDDAEDEEEAV